MFLWDPNVCKPDIMFRDSRLASSNLHDPPYFADVPPEHPPGLPGPGDVLQGDLLSRVEVVNIVLVTAALRLDTNQVSRSELS